MLRMQVCLMKELRQLRRWAYASDIIRGERFICHRYCSLKLKLWLKVLGTGLQAIERSIGSFCQAKKKNFQDRWRSKSNASFPFVESSSTNYLGRWNQTACFWYRRYNWSNFWSRLHYSRVLGNIVAISRYFWWCQVFRESSNRSTEKRSEWWRHLNFELRIE